MTGTRDLQTASTGRRILSFGYAKPQLREKHRALSDTGFDVTSISNFRQANQLIVSNAGAFEILMIGATVPERERRALSRLFRRLQPGGKVVVFYRHSIANVEGGTVVLSEQRFPENLLESMKTLERQQGRGTEISS